MAHNELAAQMVRQARVAGDDGEFAIVFAAMGVKNDVAEFFRRNFEEAGALQRVVMFLNLASDPHHRENPDPPVRPDRRGVPGLQPRLSRAGGHDGYDLLLRGGA